MPFKTTQLWLGTQESYDSAVSAVLKAEADPKFSASSDYQSEITDRIMSVQDGVATINVNGSLVNGSAGYAIYYGITGYDDIRNALSAAISNTAVSGILLNVNSGGGHVAGVHELGQLVARVSAIKPVVTYAGSMMGSAALWTGINASHVVSSETAIVGSIGIIMVNLDRSKQLDEMGIKATVIRAGTEKALASPYEPLSDNAKEKLQNQADTLYDVFIGQVAKARKVSATVADSKFGQGREFIGKQALAVGLVDAVGTFEDAYLKAVKLGSSLKMGKSANRTGAMATNSRVIQANISTGPEALADNQPTSEGTPMPKPLTPEVLAAMAAGVDLTDTTVADQTTATAGTEAKPAADVPVTEPAATVDALTVLQGMLATATTAAATAEAKTGQLQKDFDALTAQASAFTEIARASVKTMGLHFGVKSEAVAAMSPAEVLSEHTRLSDLFKAKFKVGSVAATTQVDEPETKAQVNPLFAAALLSTKAR